MSPSVLLAFGLVAAYLNPVSSISCFIGNDSKTTVSEDVWDYCLMVKNTDSKLITYLGSNKGKDLSRDKCWVEFDYDKEILNVKCYCTENKCNVPGTMDPKY
uniref:Activin_recp domain-containing protein n=1 Tax=Caenorhabditis tropicalis TaxID=1561998 RepID=A0A1I7TY25_9PELO